MFVVVVYVVCRAKIEEEKKLRGKRRKIVTRVVVRSTVEHVLVNNVF